MYLFVWILVTLLVVIVASPMRAAEPIRVEAEHTRPAGGFFSTTRPAFSGTGYVTGIDDDSDKIIFHVGVPESGVYSIAVRYSAPSFKGYVLDVNGLKTQGGFPPSMESTFATHEHGLVELDQGMNTLTFERGWGYYDIDYIELTKTEVPAPPIKTPVTLSDPEATPETRRLMQWLVSNFGQYTISGVYDEADLEHVKRVTGKTPLMLGGDLMDYSPSRVEHGTNPDGTVERLIEHAKRGHIITLSWHWNAPSGLINKEQHVTEQGRTINALWWRGFYTEATTFDIERALANKQSEDYRLLLRDIDAIAEQLRKFQDAKVPVLWRPLHEAEGKWFWWGAKGPAPLKELWRLMHDRLTNHHELHNLIWVYTVSYDIEWYPGDDYVDVLGVDSYPPDVRDPLTGAWQTLQKEFAGRKLLAISEIGKVADVPRMHRLGAWWSYFTTWTGDLGPRGAPDDVLKQVFNHPGVLNLEDATDR